MVVDEDIINEAPTVDPIRHGKILQVTENAKHKRVFSCCNTDCTTMTMWMWPKYCPWCGARLDGELDETN